MIWACFAAAGPVHLAVIESITNSSSVPKCSGVKCEDICLTAKAWPKFGHPMGQRFQVQQQICNRITDKENNQGVAVAQQKSRTQPD